mgnify:CR=1 FL=1
MAHEMMWKTGETVTFGSYWQSPSAGKQPIEWIVLREQGSRRLLISHRALDQQPYNVSGQGTSWTESTLRDWLNKIFLDAAFSAEEQAALRLPAEGEIGHEETGDKVFLLNEAEVRACFPKKRDAVCWGTAYAQTQGVSQGSEMFGHGCAWWLRTSYSGKNSAGMVGKVGDTGFILVKTNYLGVRPVIWVDLSILHGEEAPEQVMRKTDDHDVFISYSGFEKDMAVAICDTLERDGIRCWYADRDLQSTGDYEEYASTVSHAIQNTRVFILLMTSRAAQSRAIMNEIRVAKQARRAIVGLIVEPLDMREVHMFTLMLENAKILNEPDSAMEQRIELLRVTVRNILESPDAPAPKTMETEERCIPDDSGNYIFISYSHKNKDQVIPIIRRLQREGYAVWYDEGIDPGTEWDENIAAHIAGCAYFIAMLSKEFLESSNCRDELYFAREEEKNRVLVYLTEDVQLPVGMRMRLGRLQAIHKYSYADEAEFYEKLLSAQGIEVCKKE